MNYETFIRTFQSHIQNLSYEKQLTLAISVCKKLYPDYHQFYQANKWGNLDTLIDLIKICEDQKVNQSNLQEYRSKALDIAPHSEDFGNASYSINAYVPQFMKLWSLLLIKIGITFMPSELV